ncbi:choline dehydrogenase-like flavoprotein [Mycobacterium sp. OAS707]|uniref:GMC family oxidoreductase N-terminal domain-containing protein n=1 Tax=Mycobacterium sp. OAS707 TaxID=2663822 RepID=UPI00178AF3F8|nr:GMC family oxidoreductase N-terminal domain-containing protein [Mycobacterium sp. OAS707]MBE1549652.1 choline dehydrogenase-like flavoprotein [Mycobacterium sp. OAS707]
MPTQFTTLQCETLTAIVDTYVASVAREDDPDGFYAAKGSDVGADVATEQYLLTRLPEVQLAGMLALIDGLALFEFKDQPQAAREEILANVAAISPEAAGAVAALNQLSVLFAYSLPGPDGHNRLWAGMGYPGPAQNPPPNSRKTLEVIAVSGETTLEADVVVVGSGSGGGVAAAVLAEAGKRVIILEAGSYHTESDFVQSEVAAYQNLFLRGGFFPSADGMVSIAAGSTVGGGSTVNWSNSLLTPSTVRSHWAEAGLTDVDTPAFDEHLQAVFERIQCNDKVATQNGPHARLSDGASRLGYAYRVATLNIDPERYDPNLIGYSGMGDQTGAKQGTMRTYLQDASDAGAKLLPNVWVDRILTEDGVAVGVQATYTDPQTQQTSRVVINAPAVVAAAGSLETPGLLLRSGIGGPAVGAELRLHPASLVSGVYDEPQDPWYGPAMAGIMNEFAEADEGFGYLIECVQHLPGLFTTVVPWLDGAQHKELTRKYRYRADWVFIVKDRGAGSVTLDENGQSTFWYPFSDELDRRHFREAAVTSIRMHEAAGAQQIFVAGQPFAPWNRGEDLEAFIAKVNDIPIGPGGIPVFSAHQMCSAKLGSDPQTSVAKPSGELHDSTGVWIADASGMPSCSGVNPMVSTMALARRTAMNMLGEN